MRSNAPPGQLVSSFSQQAHHECPVAVASGRSEAARSPPLARTGSSEGWSSSTKASARWAWPSRPMGLSVLDPQRRSVNDSADLMLIENVR